MRTPLLLVVISSLVACSGARSKTTAPASAADIVHVTIARDGSTTFEGRRVDSSELPVRAHETIAAHPNATVMIDAEREVSFQVVMTTVERLRQGGANHVAFGSIVAPSAPGNEPSSPSASAFVSAANGAAPALVAMPAGGGGATSGVVATRPRHATGPTPDPHALVPVNTKWDCAFPSERGPKEAAVLVRVHVETDGKPLSVDVLEDPGAGFGAAAKRCALDKAYQPARDVNGQAVRSTTFPFYIQFVTK